MKFTKLSWIRSKVKLKQIGEARKIGMLQSCNWCMPICNKKLTFEILATTWTLTIRKGRKLNFKPTRTHIYQEYYLTDYVFSEK